MLPKLISSLWRGLSDAQKMDFLRTAHELKCAAENRDPTVLLFLLDKQNITREIAPMLRYIVNGPNNPLG
jgi:hypothetical protein